MNKVNTDLVSTSWRKFYLHDRPRRPSLTDSVTHSSSRHSLGLLDKRQSEEVACKTSSDSKKTIYEMRLVVQLRTDRHLHRIPDPYERAF